MLYECDSGFKKYHHSLQSLHNRSDPHRCSRMSPCPLSSSLFPLALQQPWAMPAQPYGNVYGTASILGVLRTPSTSASYLPKYATQPSSHILRNGTPVWKHGAHVNSHISSVAESIWLQESFSHSFKPCQKECGKCSVYPYRGREDEEVAYWELPFKKRHTCSVGHKF